MRLTTPGDTAPASVNRYLLPNERQYITVRLHTASLLLPVSLVPAPAQPGMEGGQLVGRLLRGDVAADAAHYRDPHSQGGDDAAGQGHGHELPTLRDGPPARVR